MPNVTHRLSEFIQHKSVSVSKFESLCGIGQSIVSKAIKNNTEFGYGVLEKISQKFPELNMNWLISQKGEMLIGDEKQPSTDGERENKVMELQQKLVMELQQKLIACYEENTKLKESTTVNRHTAAR